MSRELPEWQAYDPASSPLPDIRGFGDRPKAGLVLVLLAAPGAREDGWSARAAAALASGMADKGRRVFLADVDMGRPGLHRVLGVANDEGVSDAFVYGASIQRVARPVDDGRYFFAPAGTPVGDASAVAASARWEPVLEGFRTARADVVLLVPSDQDGAERLLERATDVVILAARNDGASAAGAADRVRAVLGPGEAPRPAEAAASSRERDAVGGDSARLGATPPLPSSRRGAAPAAIRRGPVASPQKPRSRTVPLLVLLLLVLAAAAGAWWMGLVEIPGVPSRGEPGPEETTAVSIENPAPPGTHASA